MKKYKYPKIGGYLLFVQDHTILLSNNYSETIERGSVAEIYDIIHEFHNDESMSRLVFKYKGRLIVIDSKVHSDRIEFIEEKGELEAARILFGDKDGT